MSNTMVVSGRFGRGRAAGLVLLFTLAVSCGAQTLPQTQALTVAPPPTLQATGLYSDFGSLHVDSHHLAFAPQYPLWSDGATKRRWISLPPGTAIDASNPEAWEFPVGTRFWKEFSFKGQRVETRYMERLADGSWLYAAYAWSTDGKTAEFVSGQGKRGAYPLGDGRSHTIPSVSDCKVCHQGSSVEVLGFSALQLSDRDPHALHGEARPAPEVDLRYLVDKGLLTGLAGALYQHPPRIAARTDVERVAFGYLHGNCGHCHNREGSLANLRLFLRQSPVAVDRPPVGTIIGQPIHKLAPGQSPDALLRIKPGHPDRSALVQRVGSRYPALQMPPLGTELVDEEAVSLLKRWIDGLDEQKGSAQPGR